MPNVITDLANQYAYKRDVPSTDGKSSVEIQPKSSEPVKISPKQDQALEEKSAIDPSELASKVENLNQLVSRDLEFSVDDETGQQVLRVIDSETGKVIRQVPSDQILHVISQVQKATEGMLQGVLLDDKF
ncbi:MAG: flagellar protein FlaG [Candidatus Thiodiazotropha lotti]|uniref:Flagellar protein FlaG n=1 Tax=Candidatus Thiodiazotropha lotti TaxID=2792787 RepID=A0A9E4MZW5_9GAMM|nr:flagellar protein FlaG [Candidatus Thiodiazotropha lotti]MCG7900792.1 flagellar protein FlaG [Candidatus Thiodiazotropha weberae]MCG7916077.1 flagellar protein FlaG [Candidatus Thiodiazotropha weberae]MCG7923841.1 flagellar protein FlaG [Candidatus Thiodiazotropha lotti]MCG7931610.1 flagellar protein FlaG [Candidatus Thiodiazotropha lotti]